MNKRFFYGFIVIACLLVVLPLWASYKGVGSSSGKTVTDSQGNVRHYSSRGWFAGGFSFGK